MIWVAFLSIPGELPRAVRISRFGVFGIALRASCLTFFLAFTSCACVRVPSLPSPSPLDLVLRADRRRRIGKCVLHVKSPPSLTGGSTNLENPRRHPQAGRAPKGIVLTVVPSFASSSCGSGLRMCPGPPADAAHECECLELPARMPCARAWAVAPLGATRGMRLHDCILTA